MITYIIAHDRTQAVEAAHGRGLGLTEWHYVTTPERLRGLNDPHVIIVDWPARWTLADIEDAEMALALADRGGAGIERGSVPT